MGSGIRKYALVDLEARRAVAHRRRLHLQDDSLLSRSATRADAENETRERERLDGLQKEEAELERKLRDVRNKISGR